MDNDILCQECFERYSKLLQAQRVKTGEFNARISQMTQSTQQAPRDLALSTGNVDSSGQVAQELLQPIQEMKRSDLQTEELLTESQLQRKQRRNTTILGCFLLGLGLAALVAAVVFASSILTFIGLGLTLWGTLTFFIQPKSYVRSDLMNATAISSLKTIDHMMLGLGYREKGVYMREHDSDKAVVFVPAEPFSKIPELSGFEKDRTFLSDPSGLLIPPPRTRACRVDRKEIGFQTEELRCRGFG